MKSSGPERDQEHDREHGRALGGEVAVAIERPGEVEPEHPRAAVGAERLGRDERGEERERAADEERVLAVGDEVVDGQRVERARRSTTETSAGANAIASVIAGSTLWRAPPPEPEHASHREDREREDRPGGRPARAVVAAVAEAEEPCALLRAHAPVPR